MLSVQSIQNAITNIVRLHLYHMSQFQISINLNMLLQKIKALMTYIMYVDDVYQHTTFSTKPSPCCNYEADPDQRVHVLSIKST